eukprot:2919707-Amphidinium_carterae.2
MVIPLSLGRIAYLKFAVFPDDVLLPVRALQNIFGDEFTSALPELALHHLVRVEGICVHVTNSLCVCKAVLQLRTFRHVAALVSRLITVTWPHGRA